MWETGFSGAAECAPMAKKKAPAKKATPRGRQEILLVYKADPQTAEAFKAWLTGLADHVGAPVTVTLDMALKEFAVSRKYPKVMPKRLVR
jgi:hypothetical protein